jgi:hypothetical protein
MPAATNIVRARISTQMEPRQRAEGTSDDRVSAVPFEWKSLSSAYRLKTRLACNE